MILCAVFSIGTILPVHAGEKDTGPVPEEYTGILREEPENEYPEQPETEPSEEPEEEIIPEYENEVFSGIPLLVSYIKENGMASEDGSCLYVYDLSSSLREILLAYYPGNHSLKLLAGSRAEIYDGTSVTEACAVTFDTGTGESRSVSCLYMDGTSASEADSTYEYREFDSTSYSFDTALFFTDRDGNVQDEKRNAELNRILRNALDELGAYLVRTAEETGVLSLAEIGLPAYTDERMKELSTFVTRMYRNVLSREPDREGYIRWVKGLYEGTICPREAVYGFFFSEEYTQEENDPILWMRML